MITPWMSLEREEEAAIMETTALAVTETRAPMVELLRAPSVKLTAAVLVSLMVTRSGKKEGRVQK